MKTNLKNLGRLVGGKVSGNGNTLITGFAGINEAQAGDITFISNRKYIACLRDTKASAVVVPKRLKVSTRLPLLYVDNPDIAFTRIIEHFNTPSETAPPGIHPQAVVDRSVKLGERVSIQPFVVIEAASKIGNNTVIYPNVYIGAKVSVGNNCLIYPNVTIREGTIIGNNVIIHSGTVIGSDGFGYTRVGETHYKIPQKGIVVIEDNVEIGANVTIDRARFDRTIIGKGTKIDNLVHIAHNVVLGENCILVAQVGISGSTRLGKNVTLAGQVGVVGHISIGDNVIAAGRTVITKNIPSGMMVSGFPAQPHQKQLRQEAIIRHLPELYNQIKRRAKKTS